MDAFWDISSPLGHTLPSTLSPDYPQGYWPQGYLPCSHCYLISQCEMGQQREAQRGLQWW